MESKLISIELKSHKKISLYIYSENADNILDFISEIIKLDNIEQVTIL